MQAYTQSDSRFVDVFMYGCFLQRIYRGADFCMYESVAWFVSRMRNRRCSLCIREMSRLTWLGMYTSCIRVQGLEDNYQRRPYAFIG